MEKQIKLFDLAKQEEAPEKDNYEIKTFTNRSLTQTGLIVIEKITKERWIEEASVRNF